MVFTLVSAGQEWLNVKWEKIRREREEALSRKQKEDEEAERVSITFNLLIELVKLEYKLQAKTSSSKTIAQKYH